MKSLLFALLLTFSSQAAWAEGGVFFGLNNTTFSTTISGFKFDPVAGVEFGYHKIVDFGYTAFLRTGVGVTQRGADYEIGSFDVTVDFIMLEAPVTVLYDFNDILAAFAGFNFNYVLNASCEINSGSCDIVDSKEDFIVSFVFGGNFAVSYNHVFETYIETSMTEAYPDVEYKAFGARYIYMFD